MNTSKRESILFCQRTDDRFRNFASSAFKAQLCDQSAPVLKVKVTETEEFSSCYWAWWSNKDKEFRHIGNKRAMVEVCFPYGYEAEEERGRGHLLPVRVEVLD
jgi:hypothetical protein